MVECGEVLGSGGCGVIRKGLFDFTWNKRIGVACGLSEPIMDTDTNAMVSLVLGNIHAFSPYLRFS